MIQWYPGHMTKARRLIAEAMPSQDVIIEVLDARMPRASSNPVLTEVRGDKPCIKVLSKSDLADPSITEAWLAHFGTMVPGEGSRGTVIAIALTTSKPSEAKTRIPELCRKLVPRPAHDAVIRAMIVGIPNVGKSTLINTLVGRKVAVVGDEPAVTRGQQQIVLPSGIALSDNAGILWPKIEDPEASSRLAFGGALPDVTFDYEVVGLFGAKVLLERYPELVKARYKLSKVPDSPAELLNEIGRRRGFLRKGGIVDVHKAADVLVHEFRDGSLGRISLEAP